MQHHLVVGEKQNVVWGFGYRASSDDTRKVPLLFFEPEDRTLHWFNFFGQDEITLVPDRLHLVLGSKFERTTYTGLEVQPTVRLAWSQSAQNLLWGAVSRAARTPSRLDADLRIDVPGIFVLGNPNQKSEELIAYELGYRYLVAENLTFSLAGYYNQYDHVRSVETPAIPGEALILGNALQGHTYGGELETVIQVTPWWQVHAGYSHVQLHLERKPGSRAINEGTSEANDPKNRFSLRSYMNFPRGVELDFWLRHVGGRPNPVPVTAATLPGYATFDVRLGWRPVNNLELSIVGQNLPEAQHAESPAAVQEEIQRGFYGKVRWSF
jgi:iron complex outermembrane receptor protein